MTRRPKLPMTAARLTQTFERRTFLLGAVQGGVGLLLATRLGYLAVAENAKYRAEIGRASCRERVSSPV